MFCVIEAVSRRRPPPHRPPPRPSQALAVRRMIDVGFSGRAWLVDKYFATLLGVGLILALASAARFYCVNWLGERSSPISAPISLNTSPASAQPSERRIRAR
jgi:hypothetical protein